MGIITEGEALVDWPERNVLKAVRPDEGHQFLPEETIA